MTTEVTERLGEVIWRGQAVPDKKSEVIVATCSDNRFQNLIAEFMTNGGFSGIYADIALPGSSMSFREKIWAIKLFADEHKARVLYILDHEDCAMYKKTFGNNYPLGKHLRFLKYARGVMANLLPDLNTHTFLMRLNGEIEEIKEK